MSTTSATWQRPYQGPDRRRHVVFVTHNSEYHCRDGRCVAVRNRSTGMFEPEHRAIGLKIGASVRFTDDGGIASAHDPREAQIGEKLCFSSSEVDTPSDVLTSPLAGVARPAREVVATYPP